MFWTLWISIIITVVGVIATATLPPHYLVLMLMPTISQWVMGILRPMMMAMNMDYHPHMRGIAASLQQCCITSGFALASFVGVPLAHGNATHYAIVSSIALFIVAILWWLSMKARPFEWSEQNTH